MKSANNNILISFTAALCFMALSGLSSCTKEDWSRCPDVLPGVNIVPAALPGIEIDPADIQNVMLYIFDKNYTYVDAVSAKVGQLVTLNYPNAGNLHVVAIGNVGSGSGNESITDYNSGGFTLLEHGKISLVPGTRAAGKLCNSPCDLFWGQIDLLNDGETDESKDIPMRRIVSRVSVKAVSLKDFAGTPDHNFTYEVTTDYDTVDFNGLPSGEKVTYKPSGCQVVSGNVFESPLFNMISSDAGQPVAVEIYHDGDTLIDTITKDSDGNPLMAVNGKLLNIHIDYTGRSIDDGWLSVTVEYSGWNDPLDLGKDIQ